MRVDWGRLRSPTGMDSLLHAPRVLWLRGRSREDAPRVSCLYQGSLLRRYVEPIAWIAVAMESLRRQSFARTVGIAFAESAAGRLQSSEGVLHAPSDSPSRSK